MATGEQTTRDAANEVVRAAVEWLRVWKGENPNDPWTFWHASNDLRAAIEDHLAKNLPDSAQHPTPNPG